MNRPDDPISISEPSQVTRLEWERWPWREEPRRLQKLVLLLLIVLLVGAVLVVSLPVTAAVALGLALVVTLLPYLLPRRFAVGEAGVTIHQGFYTTRRTWAEIEDYRAAASGFALTLRPKAGAPPSHLNLGLNGSRELFLAFPLEKEKRQVLENLLARHIPADKG